jgi:antirestriction protein ArdC
LTKEIIMAFMKKGEKSAPAPSGAEVSDAVVRTRGELSERLVDQAAKGVAPWNQKLDPGQGERLPYTAFNKDGKEPQAMGGVNGIQLSSVAQEKGFKDPRWITRDQMQERGWGFKEGEKGTNIEYFTAKGKEISQAKRDAQGNQVFDENGKRVTEPIKADRNSVRAVHLFNLEQVVELKYAKTPIPELDASPRAPKLQELNQAFAQSGMEVRDAQPGQPSHVSVQGKGAVFLSAEDKASEIGAAQAKVRAMAAKALTLDTAGGWSRSDSDRTKFIKTELRVEVASRFLSDKFAIPARPEKLASFNAHIAGVLNEVNGKTQEKDQIRFVARDAARAFTRVDQGNWSRSQEWHREQAQEPPAPEQVKGQDAEPRKEAKAPAKSRAKSVAMER